MPACCGGAEATVSATVGDAGLETVRAPGEHPARGIPKTIHTISSGITAPDMYFIAVLSKLPKKIITFADKSAKTGKTSL